MASAAEVAAGVASAVRAAVSAIALPVVTTRKQPTLRPTDLAFPLAIVSVGAETVAVWDAETYRVAYPVTVNMFAKTPDGTVPPSSLENMRSMIRVALTNLAAMIPLIAGLDSVETSPRTPYPRETSAKGFDVLAVATTFYVLEVR